MKNLPLFKQSISDLLTQLFPGIAVNQPLPSFLKEGDYPSRYSLWNAWFHSVLTESELNWLQAGDRSLIKLVTRFSSQPELLNRQDVQSDINDSVLRYLSLQRLRDLSASCYEFHYLVNEWSRKNWHEQAVRTRVQLPKELSLRLGVSEWQTADWLKKTGYPYVSSDLLQRTWKQWSGSAIGNNYDDWCSYVKDEAEDWLVLDGWFSLFGKEKPGKICFQETCEDCRLNVNCSFYQDFPAEAKESIEKMILGGDIKTIKTPDLIRFLGKFVYSPAVKESGMLENHEHHYKRHFNELLVNADNEKWVAFWKGIKEWEERVQSSGAFEKGRIFKCSGDIYESLIDKLSGEQREAFYALILDNKYRLIQLHRVSQGTLNQSLVHPREVFAPALQLRAAAVVLIHNHPSGDPEPSTQDFEVTRRLLEAGKTLGVNVLDHIIFGDEVYYSFVDEGVMPTS